MIFVIAGNQKQYNDYCRSRGVHPMSGETTPLVIAADCLNARWSEGDELVITGTYSPLRQRFLDLLHDSGMPLENA